MKTFQELLALLPKYDDTYPEEEFYEVYCWYEELIEENNPDVHHFWDKSFKHWKKVLEPEDYTRFTQAYLAIYQAAFWEL